MTNSATTELVQRLIGTCQSQGWLSASAAERASSLCRQGLHPEQALLGTRLVNEDRYGEALSHVYGLPFIRVMAEPAERVRDLLPEPLQREAMAMPLALDQKELAVGYAEPSDAKQMKAIMRAGLEQGLRVKPFVILQSDWRLHRPSKPWADVTVDRLERAITSAADAGQVHGFWIHANDRLANVFLGHTDHTLPSFAFPRAFLPALRLRLERRSVRSPWVVERTLNGLDQAVHVVRRESYEDAPHPTEWMDGWRAFLKQPIGMFVVVRPDAFIRRQITERFADGEADDTRRRPCWIDARDERGRELALHAALLGRTTVAFAKTDDAWWREVAQAGIPVRVLAATHLPRQVAWSFHEETV